LKMGGSSDRRDIEVILVNNGSKDDSAEVSEHMCEIKNTFSRFEK